MNKYFTENFTVGANNMIFHESVHQLLGLTHFVNFSWICSSNVELISMTPSQHLMSKFKKNLLLVLSW